MSTIDLITYVGEKITIVDSSRTRVYFGLPALDVTYRGTPAEITKFANSRGVMGAAFTFTAAERPLMAELGDLATKNFRITNATVDDGGSAYSTITLTIAAEPDFDSAGLSNYEFINSNSIKSTSKSASIEDILTFRAIAGRNPNKARPATETTEPEPDEKPLVTATLKIEYYSPQTVYTYYASTQPQGPRFTQINAGGLPMIVSSSTIAQAGGVQRNYGGGNIPMPLASALSMGYRNLPLHTHKKIPGTTWYECSDTVTYEYQGD